MFQIPVFAIPDVWHRLILHKLFLCGKNEYVIRVTIYGIHLIVFFGPIRKKVVLALDIIKK